MKKYIIFGLMLSFCNCAVHAAEDDLLYSLALRDILKKYDVQINKDIQSKTFASCASDYFDKKVLDMDHFIFCCRQSIGRDMANLGVCDKMARDVRGLHNQYISADTPKPMETCDILWDTPKTGVSCSNYFLHALTCSMTCNAGYHKWDYKIETCEQGMKPSDNKLTCVIDPNASVLVADLTKYANGMPRHNSPCNAGQDTNQKNIQCPEDWGSTTSCDLECFAGVWSYSINGCKQGSSIGDNGICLATPEYGTERKFHGTCAKADLPSHATSGWYIKSNKNPDGLTCAAKTCENGYYIARLSDGKSSAGWCKYGKDPYAAAELAKREAEELAKLKAENANLVALTANVKGFEVQGISAAAALNQKTNAALLATDDLKIQEAGKQKVEQGQLIQKPELVINEEEAEDYPVKVFSVADDNTPWRVEMSDGMEYEFHEESAARAFVAHYTNNEFVQPCNESDLRSLHALTGLYDRGICRIITCEDDYYPDPLNGGCTSKSQMESDDMRSVDVINCTHEYLSSRNALAGTDRSDGCYIQDCIKGYHLELNGKRVTLGEEDPLRKNIQCVRDLPVIGATCPSSEFPESQYQLPSDATSGVFVKVGGSIVCSATLCSSDYDVVTTNGKGECKKKIATLPNDVLTQENDTTYVAKPEIQESVKRTNTLENNPVFQKITAHNTPGDKLRAMN